MASLYKYIGKLQRAITLIVICESKICLVKPLVSTHSVCPCKNCPPKYSQPCIIYLNLLFSRGPHTKQKKKLSGNRAGCIVEPYNASRQCKLHAKPRPSRSAWAENIANAWLPYTTYGKTSKGHNGMN